MVIRFSFVGILNDIKHIQHINSDVLEARGFVDRVPGDRFFLYLPKRGRLSMSSKWCYANFVVGKDHDGAQGCELNRPITMLWE